MPSSLEIRTRARARFNLLVAIGQNDFEPTHVGAERLGDGDLLEAF